jgi:hypothetical protein
MNKDLALIIAIVFIGLGAMVVVVTQLGPPGSVSQFQIPSPFLQICSDQECLDEQKLRTLSPEDRITGVTYGEGWVKIEYEDGSSRQHSGIRNVEIQEYIDDPYYKHKKDNTSVSFDDDWIEISFNDGSKEKISGLSQARINELLFQLSR